MFNKIRTIKYIHLYVSILLFFSFLYTSLKTKHLSLFEIQSLSKLGIHDNGWIWNSGLIIISTLLYFKIKQSIIDYCNDKILHTLNKILSINLILTAIINMDYPIHGLTAVFYFLATSLLIFIFGLKIHKTNFRIGQLSLILSILSAILPMITIGILDNLAIPEIEHILLLFIWLIILEYQSYVIKIIKWFGF